MIVEIERLFPAVAPRLGERAPERVTTIAIIGAGFSGTAVAIRLLRSLPAAPARIVLIDSRGEAGSGAAYATRDYPYPLNVPAGQMSVDPQRPLDFLQFAQNRGIEATAADFLPRPLYGDYLRSVLHAAVETAPAHVQCIQLRGRVLRVFRGTTGARWNIAFDDGRDVLADEVVLALGNPPPARLKEFDGIADSEHYIHDPWSEALHRAPNERVLLLGTGLTMADVVLRLTHERPLPLEIHALSRHGWLPVAQTAFNRCAARPEMLEAIESAKHSLRDLVRMTRQCAEETQSAGGDWREIIAMIRARVPVLWQAMNEKDRRRFLRHVSPAWNVYRHRVPAATASLLASLKHAGVLHCHTGRIEAARIVDGAVEVTWRPRSQTQSVTCVVDRVVNCTGPDYRAARSQDPLVQSLLAQRLIAPDALSLGIQTTPDYRVIGANGRAVQGLYYVGPWLRAREWEATAVPELRVHAAALANILAGNLAAQIDRRAAP